MQNQQFVRPGFELGFKKDGKYYINNHLVFNILVYETNGEFTAAKRRCVRLVSYHPSDVVKVRGGISELPSQRCGQNEG